MIRGYRCCDFLFLNACFPFSSNTLAMKSTCRIVWFLYFISFQSTAGAAIWQVGPLRTYTAPSQVSGLVSSGDTVEIDAGVYPGDVAGWTAHNLTLRGVGGKAHLQANGNAWGQKAIWVIAGNHNIIEDIEFSGCSVPDMNGAGIRIEGQGLRVTRCYFHHNENGILASTLSVQKIVIEHSEFAWNGYGDGYSHNLYINHTDTLLFRYNYSHHALVGHELKSRAHVNIILYNRFSNESTGTASRCIDLPNGGTALLMGNVIHQGPVATNNNAVSFGLEGLTNNAPHQCIVVSNTLVNERSICNFFSINELSGLFKARNNILAGNGNFHLGTLPANTDTAANITGSIQDFAFADAAQYDFRLTAQSLPALNMAVAPGSLGSTSLVPDLVYVHPSGVSPRCVNGIADAGAYEYCGNIGMDAIGDATDFSFSIFPNPAADHGNYLIFSDAQVSATLMIMDPCGRIIMEQQYYLNPGLHQGVLPTEQLRPGVYLVNCKLNEQIIMCRWVIDR